MNVEFRKQAHADDSEPPAGNLRASGYFRVSTGRQAGRTCRAEFQRMIERATDDDHPFDVSGAPDAIRTV